MVDNKIGEVRSTANTLYENSIASSHTDTMASEGVFASNPITVASRVVINQKCIAHCKRAVDHNVVVADDLTC